jgi:hypothetical protein
MNGSAGAFLGDTVILHDPLEDPVASAKKRFGGKRARYPPSAAVRGQFPRHKVS